MVPARAFESRLIIAYAGLCGHENGSDHQGGSAIVGPGGEDLARADLGPFLLVAEVTLEAYATGRWILDLADRRLGLYRLGSGRG